MPLPRRLRPGAYFVLRAGRSLPHPRPQVHESLTVLPESISPTKMKRCVALQPITVTLDIIFVALVSRMVYANQNLQDEEGDEEEDDEVVAVEEDGEEEVVEGKTTTYLQLTECAMRLTADNVAYIAAPPTRNAKRKAEEPVEPATKRTKPDEDDEEEEDDLEDDEEAPQDDADEEEQEEDEPAVGVPSAFRDLSSAETIF